jgi:two-component system, OmpR family, sensor histidine kinase MprB
MTFRARLILVAAAAVALAVVGASAVVYVVVRDQLRGQVDASLIRSASKWSQSPPASFARPFFNPDFSESFSFPMLVREDGHVPGGQSVSFPVAAQDLAVARGADRLSFRDARIQGVHMRILTVRHQFLPGYAVDVARPLTEVDHALSRIRLYLLLIAGGGIAVASALGYAVSRAALAPVTRLTEATEKVTATGDLSERIEAGGSDELSRLATSFNTMLAALEDSTRAQRQLVADASHELRTPLTSLRTNVEVLAGGRELPPGERERLLRDVIEQTGELTNLLAELIELARGEVHVTEPEDVRLDLVAAQAVERARRNRPGVTFRTELAESVVHGVPANLERAIANLIDNAAKWSPPGGEVEVRVEEGSVVIRDHGPGIAEEDLPFVFDRFYRAASARGMPGSGLGLAIVRQVAEMHGGGITAERAEGGGTRMTLRLNGVGPSSANGS